MTAMPQTVVELESFIRDHVRSEVADVAVSNMERAQAEAETIRAQQKNPADLAEFAKLAEERRNARAKVDSTGKLVSDPLKGRGLGFARLARTLALAEQARTTPVAAAKMLAAQGGEEYARLGDVLEQRLMSQGSFAQGGSLVPPEMAAEMVELLYAKTVALALGARTMEFQASINIGKLNSGASVAYAGENALIVPSTPGTGELRLAGKKAVALVGVTNELLRNPSVGADAILRDDLLQAMALRRDLSALRGTGDASQPKGVTKWINSSNYFNSAGTTTANKVADLVKAVRLVDESNIDLTSGGWAMSPRSKWALFATLDSNSNFVFAQQLAMGMLLGFPVRTTTQIPNNLGGGTDSEVYFGAWADLIIGFDKVTPLSLEFFPNGTYHDGSALVSGISQDQTPVRLMEAHDVVLRHDNTFARIDAVAWT